MTFALSGTSDILCTGTETGAALRSWITANAPAGWTVAGRTITAGGHGLGTGDVSVTVRDAATGEIVFTDVAVGTSSPFNAVVSFASAPTAGQYRVTVLG